MSDVHEVEASGKVMGRAPEDVPADEKPWEMEHPGGPFAALWEAMVARLEALEARLKPAAVAAVKKVEPPAYVAPAMPAMSEPPVVHSEPFFPSLVVPDAPVSHAAPSPMDMPVVHAPVVVESPVEHE